MELNTKARGSNMRMGGKSGMGSKLLTPMSPIWAGEQKNGADVEQALSGVEIGRAHV